MKIPLISSVQNDTSSIYTQNGLNMTNTSLYYLFETLGKELIPIKSALRNLGSKARLDLNPS